MTAVEEWCWIARWQGKMIGGQLELLRSLGRRPGSLQPKPNIEEKALVREFCKIMQDVLAA
jgi:hypothetical protein